MSLPSVQGILFDLSGVLYVGSQPIEGAIVIGKPSPDFFEMALKDMGLAASEVALVGDDIDSDVGGGQRAGLTGILVKTGKFRESDLAESKIQPDAILESVSELPAALHSLQRFGAKRG